MTAKPNYPEYPKPAHPMGYTEKELKSICRKLKVRYWKFLKAFGVNTVCGDEKTGEVLHYPCDVERAFAKVLGYRKVSEHEWD